MFNPNVIFKVKKSWEVFTQNHPKFQPFLQAAAPQIQAGTVIEVAITNPQGDKVTTNLKITESDMELFESLKGIV